MEFELPAIAPRVVATVGDFNITETMLSTCIVTVALIVFAAVVRIFFIPRWNKDFKHISAFRMFFEWVVGIFDGNAEEMTEKYSYPVGSLYFGCSAFIMFGILIELLGLRSPMSDLNCNLVLGLITFFTVLIFGFIKNKSRRLLHYAAVIPLITDCIVPFSMALRLFGSVYSGYLIMDLVYQTALRNILPVILEPVFTLFHALIQSFIFMFLSMNFVNEAIE
ncbi:MAG: F0F1 ATP synthase subunit A [Clostridiales bacterium]|nr:F0F1 ATP synthase subunit A [Clostridiales bacterium]